MLLSIREMKLLTLEKDFAQALTTAERQGQLSMQRSARPLYEGNVPFTLLSGIKLRDMTDPVAKQLKQHVLHEYYPLSFNAPSALLPPSMPLTREYFITHGQRL